MVLWISDAVRPGWIRLQFLYGLISADDLKKTLPGYSPEKSEQFHSESAHLADKQFEQALKSRPEKTVILMAGGTASGKSEYVSAYLHAPIRWRKRATRAAVLPGGTGVSSQIRSGGCSYVLNAI
jgi:hypothetical protein